MADVDYARIVRAYKKMREAKSAAKKVYDEEIDRINEQMVKVEMYLLQQLNVSNVKSMRTDEGTVYKQKEIRPSAENWDEVYAWIKENDAFEFLEKRITKTAVIKYMDDNEQAVPPGMRIHTEWTAHVRAN